MTKNQLKVLYDRYADKELINYKGEEIPPNSFKKDGKKIIWRDIAGNYYEIKEKDWKSFAKRFDILKQYSKEKRNYLKEKKLIFGGRILANYGIEDSKGSYFNCLVLPAPEDSMEGIFTRLKESALVLKSGMGYGMRIDSLRPKNAPLSSSKGASSGSLSFTKIFSDVCGIIQTGGSRRGGIMPIIRYDHPDILDFIDSKLDLENNPLINANISILIDNNFISAVEDDKEIELKFGDKIYNKIKARHIRDKWMKAMWTVADPSPLFWDNIIKWNNTEYFQPLSGVNLCSEIPLPDYGACILSSIVLPNIKNDEELEDVAKVLVYFLNDEIIEKENYLLPQIKEIVLASRRLGIGYIGLADWLILNKVKYGSRESKRLINYQYKKLALSLYKASIQYAADRGVSVVTPYEFLEKAPFFREKIYPNLSIKYQEMFIRYGIANSTLVTQAPTGTTSMLMGYSNGIEPIFQLKYIRKDRLGNRVIYHPLYEKLKDNDEYKDYWIIADQIKWKDRLEIQSAAQEWIDNAISSTINLPKETSEMEIWEIIKYAHSLGLKGIAIYREGSREGVLVKESSNNKEKDKFSTALSFRLPNSIQKKRPKILKGYTYKTKYRGKNIYIIINFKDNLPNEVFFIDSTASKEFIALGRLFTFMFRKLANNDEVKLLINELQEIPNSIHKHVGDALIEALKYIDKDDINAKEKCPICGFALIRNEGCMSCPNCGYSKCLM